MTGSALFFGDVVHERVRPRRHRLRYSVFWMLLDLGDQSMRRGFGPLFGYDRPGMLSFREADHGDGSDAPLREQVLRHLRTAGIDSDDGPVRLFCMPRVLGYGFNPISVFFCHRPDETLAAILYEVNNTFGDRHAYLLPAQAQPDGTIRQGCAKTLYVSPFMGMDMRYEFRLRLSEGRIALAIDGLDPDGMIIRTALQGKRRPFSAATLARALAGFPLLTLKVIAAIHWEALLLWLKGVKMTKRRPAPSQPVTVGLPLPD